MRPPGSAVPGTAADLFFAVFADTSEIGMLSHVEAAARRSDVRVAWIVELCTPGWLERPTTCDSRASTTSSCRTVPWCRPSADHRRAVLIPPAGDRRPLRPLGAGRARPDRRCRQLGRRLAGTHTPLVKAMVDRDLYYHFDTVSGPWSVTDHVEHRVAQASLLHRTRYPSSTASTTSPDGSTAPAERSP